MGRRGSSPTHLRLRLATFISLVGNNRATAVFIDLEKAFELADFTVFLSLLANKGVRETLLQWTRDFLTNREAQVIFQGVKSLFHFHQQGNPQGSVLSPFLFNMLIEAFLYLPLFRGSQGARAQRDLSLLYYRCREVGLKLNSNKTKAMAFFAAPPNNHLYVGRANIDWVESHQYLGSLIRH